MDSSIPEEQKKALKEERQKELRDDKAKELEFIDDKINKMESKKVMASNLSSNKLKLSIHDQLANLQLKLDNS